MPAEARLTPPHRAALWASLKLTKTQLARLCGLSVRQVSYWAAQGYLPHAPRDPECYSGDAVDMAVLIKRGLDQGLTLRHAVRCAHDYLAAELAREPDLHALDAEQLRAARARLAQADSDLRAVLAVVEPLTPPLADVG